VDLTADLPSVVQAMKTLLVFLFLIGVGVTAGVCDAQAPLPDAPPGGAAYSPGVP